MLTNTKRTILRIDWEAQSPMMVGSGKSNDYTDALIIRDWNHLPYLPGSALAGVIKKRLRRATLPEGINQWDDILGTDHGKSADPQMDDDSIGSAIAFSDGLLITHDNAVHETATIPSDTTQRMMEHLPIRNHVKITHRGTAQDKQLFNHEVLYRGCRFRCEIEVLADTSDYRIKEVLLDVLQSSILIGGGTRNGCGLLQPISFSARSYDLQDKASLLSYLSQDSSLNDSIDAEVILVKEEVHSADYQIKVAASNTSPVVFLIASGYGSKLVDAYPMLEACIAYDSDTQVMQLTDDVPVLPATSIKGALSHRVAYHYNILTGKYADQAHDPSEPNPVVEALFGSAATDESNEGQAGKVIIQDHFFQHGHAIPQTKLFNHVKIDRFTGGAWEGGLFNEMTVVITKPFNINIKVIEKDTIDPDIIKALESALADMADGLLPLGAKGSIGHGNFSGELVKI